MVHSFPVLKSRPPFALLFRMAIAYFFRYNPIKIGMKIHILNSAERYTWKAYSVCLSSVGLHLFPKQYFFWGGGRNHYTPIHSCNKWMNTEKQRKTFFVSFLPFVSPRRDSWNWQEALHCIALFSKLIKTDTYSKHSLRTGYPGILWKWQDMKTVQLESQSNGKLTGMSPSPSFIACKMGNLTLSERSVGNSSHFLHVGLVGQGQGLGLQSDLGRWDWLDAIVKEVAEVTTVVDMLHTLMTFSTVR